MSSVNFGKTSAQLYADIFIKYGIYTIFATKYPKCNK